MSTKKNYFNGINADTGEYLFPPLTTEDLVDIAKREKFGNFGDSSKNSDALKNLKRKKEEGLEKNFAPNADVDDPTDLAQTGWGVIFASDADPAIRESLQVLLNHRKEQATKIKEIRYQEFKNYKGFREEDTTQEFLTRNKVPFGPVNPDIIPYYLLIVGEPNRIPFLFQQELSVQFAVGRIYFDKDENESKEDYLKKYARYAYSVVEAEKKGLSLPRRASFFGVQNGDDEATKGSIEQLVKPLANYIKQSQQRNNWNIETVLLEDATKKKLKRLLGGDETPALLFTSSHGVGYPKGDSRQSNYQGSIICQDWHGSGVVSRDFLFSKDDVSDDANLFGLIAFHFACYSAGTPQFDEFSHRQDKSATNSDRKLEIATRPFIASLPQRLLSHPNGTALAVIGHVDRAWTTSFMWKEVDQTEVFKSTLKELTKGQPIGWVFEKRFSNRHAQISVQLGKLFEDINLKRPVGYGQDEIDPNLLVSLWTGNNDARNYVILGDPAVKLMVGDSPQVNPKRPTIGELNFSINPSVPAPSDEPDNDFATQLKQNQTNLNKLLEKLIEGLDTQGSVNQLELKKAMSHTISLLEILNKIV